MAGYATPSCRRRTQLSLLERRIRMSDPRLWLAGIALLPALVIAASYLGLEVERLRRLSVVCAMSMLLAALGVAITPQLRVLSLRTSALSWLTEGEAVIRIN